MSSHCNKQRERPGAFMLLLYADKGNPSAGSPKALAAPAGPSTTALHSPIGSSLLTAYELLIGSRTGQDCHLQLPGQAWLSPREQGEEARAGAAGLGAPSF